MDEEKIQNTKLGNIGFYLSLVAITYYILIIIYRFTGKFEIFFYYVLLPFTIFAYLLPIASVILCVIQLSKKRTILAIFGLIISILFIIVNVLSLLRVVD